MMAHEDITSVDPETVGPDDINVDHLRAALQSEDNLERTHGARIVAMLAEQDLTHVDALVPTLVDVLDDDRIVVLRESLSILAAVAQDNPEDVVDAVPTLVELLEHDTPLIQLRAASVVRQLALADVELFASHVDDLLSVMERADADPLMGHDPSILDSGAREDLLEMAGQDRRREDGARAIAAAVVHELAIADPAAIRPYADRFLALVPESQGAVLMASVGAIDVIAETDRECVTDAVEPLCDVLNVPDRVVQMHAISALGHIGDPAAVDALRSFAESDASLDEDVREVAVETGDWLAAQT
jgi:HEAT repeat protein